GRPDECGWQRAARITGVRRLARGSERARANESAGLGPGGGTQFSPLALRARRRAPGHRRRRLDGLAAARSRRAARRRGGVRRERRLTRSLARTRSRTYADAATATE